MSKAKEGRVLYAVRKGAGRPGRNEGSQLIGSNEDNFVLAIGGPVLQSGAEAWLVEQERNKFGQFMYAFEAKQALRLQPETILAALPLSCSEEEGRFCLMEEQVRKFILQFKILLQHDESEESDYSRYSQSHQQMQLMGGFSSSIDHRCRGRPRGSRNRRKDSVEKSSEEEFVDESKKVQEKRGRGRPKGAKNIKKQQMVASEGYWNELNVYRLFANLLQTKSIEQVNTRISRLKNRDDRAVVVKKEELQGEELIKRSRGRPKGVKNKPKLTNDDSESEQTQQLQSIPRRKPNKNIPSWGKCCGRCHEKELKKMLFEGKEVAISELTNLAEPFSPQNHNNVLLHAIRSTSTELLLQVLALKDQRETPFALPWEASSRLEDCGYTFRTRKEFVTKGKKEGIHALIQDSYRSCEPIWWKAIGLEAVLEAIPFGQKGVDIYMVLQEAEPELRQQVDLNIASVVRTGNETLASFLLERVLKSEANAMSYGYSPLHWQALQKKKGELQFKKSAMVKQSCTNNFCSPIHCASINSNPELLAHVLRHLPDLAVGDSIGRKPVHYAAVAEQTRQLELLVKHGADLKELDKRKTTPLMLAARFGRHKTLKYILERVRDPHYLNFRNDDGLAALHHALIGQHFDCFALLLDDPLLDRQVETREGMNAFHLAAATGQREALRLLLERQLSPQPDALRRTPLMTAIRNYQNDAFFLLFSSVSRYYKRDYSYNTMLHYAAAYGNVEIVKYLQEIGVVQTMNRKKFYPFEVAVLKGHFQCAKMLENWALHFSHHLPNRLSKNPRATPEFYRMFEYLLQTKKYDLNYRNPAAWGYTCLHFICALSQADYLRLRSKESSRVEPDEFQQMQEKLISLLLRFGADPEVENQRGEKPIRLCIQHQNLVGIQLLLREIPFELQPLRTHNYTYYLSRIACLGKSGMQFVYQKFLETQEKVLRQQLKKVDVNGFQFLIYLIKKFTENVHTNFRRKYKESLGLGDTRTAVLAAFEDYLEHEQVLIKTVRHLVETGADPKFMVSEPRMDEQYENYKKWGIQHFLMRFPSPNLLRIFMKWIDTSFNLQNSEGRTPLHLFCLWNSQHSIFQQPNDGLPPIDYPEMKHFQGTRCLEYLLENGLTSNVLDINRSTPLLYAATRQQLAFIRLLRNFGSTINNVNSLNQVPLIELIRHRQGLPLQHMETLLADEDLRSDYTDMNQRNALHHLVSVAKNFDNSPQICRRLLESGVDVNSLDKFGRSPIFYCFIGIEENECSTEEDANDKVEILQCLLGQPGIDLHILDTYRRSPLHYACERGFFFSILYLLERWQHPDQPDADGNTPLAICLKHSNLNQAAMLIKKGVRYGSVVEEGHTYSYVEYALKKLTVGICFMLIDHGYPLDKALDEAGSFRSVLAKKYSK